jgi:putative effector of murein hydrolase LrgA (UPF0299 family)
MKYKPPETAEIAQRLIQRSDDTAEKIKVRYREFKANIDAVQSCYKDVMVVVDGSQQQEKVSYIVLKALITVCIPTMEIQIAPKIDHPLKSNVSESQLTEITKAFSMLIVLFAMEMASKFICQTLKISFPHPLFGMIILFSSLVILSQFNIQSSDQIFLELSYASSLIKKWMVLFFVPPLVALPTKFSLLKNSEWKLFGVIIFGLISSLLSTGVFAEFLLKKGEKSIPLANDNNSNNKQKETIETKDDPLSKVLQPPPLQISFPSVRFTFSSMIALYLCKYLPLSASVNNTISKLFQLFVNFHI